MTRRTSTAPLATLALMLAAGTLTTTSLALPARALAAQAGQQDAQNELKAPKNDKDNDKDKAKDKDVTAGPSSSGIARGDFDNDGFGDLAVGVPLEGFGTSQQAGGVNVIYGTADGLRATGNQFWQQGASGVPGLSETGDQFGRSLASGDFNHDGFSDLAIGAPFEDTIGALVDAGQVTVLFGSATGLTAAGAQTLLSPSPDAGARFGWSLAWGDFVGTAAVADLAVAAPRYTGGGAEERGFVTLYTGTPGEGLSYRQSIFQNDFKSAVESNLEDAFDRFGETLAAGDFNADRHSDLAIGVPHKNLHGRVNAGMVYISHSLINSLSTSSVSFRRLQQSIGDRYADETGDLFGAAMAAGDFDADGYQDLAVGIPGEDLGGGADAVGPFEGSRIINTGMVMVYGGSDGGLSTFGRRAWGQPATSSADETGDAFGSSLAAADFNGNGAADLAIGAPFEDVSSGGTTVVDAGAVFVLNDVGIPIVSTQLWHQNQGWGSGTTNPNDHFGQTLTAWNFGHGAQADLAIGIPGEDIAGLPDVGMVQVLYGTGAGLSTPGNQFWNQFLIRGTAEAFDSFGLALY